MHRHTLDWPTLGAAATQGLTLVIYMGVSSIDTLQAGLLETLPAATPAAVIQHASLPHQRQLVCALGELAAQVHAERIESPAIVVVGNVLSGIATLSQAAQTAQAA